MNPYRGHPGARIERCEVRKRATLPGWLFSFLAVALAGCASMDGPKSIATGAKVTLDATQPVLHEWCTVPAQAALAKVRAMPPGPDRERAADAARDELVARKCPAAMTAYDDLRVARIGLLGVISATEAGQCLALSKTAKGCDVAGAIVDVGKAAAEVSTKMKEIRR